MQHTCRLLRNYVHPIYFDYFELKKLQNALEADASASGRPIAVVNIAKLLETALRQRVEDVKAYRETLRRLGFLPNNDRLFPSRYPLPKGCPVLQRDPLLDLVRFRANAIRAMAMRPRNGEAGPLSQLAMVPFSAMPIVEIELAISFDVINWECVYWLPHAVLPEISEHRVVAQSYETNTVGIVQDFSDVARLAEEQGYKSKWWLRRMDMPHFLGVPHARCYQKYKAETCSLNDIQDPFYFLQSTVVRDRFAETNEHNEKLFRAHMTQRGFSFPFYNAWGADSGSTDLMRGPLLLRDRFCKVPLDKKEKIFTEEMFNIEQLRRPLPPAVVASVKEHYTKETARLAALAASGDDSAWPTEKAVPVIGSIREIRYSKAKQRGPVGSPSEAPVKKKDTRRLREVCIDGFTGESLFDAAPVLRDSHFPTKIFFKTDDLLELGLKILPNAKPLIVPQFYLHEDHVNVEEFMDIAASLSRLTSSIVRTEEDAALSEAVYARARMGAAYRSQIVSAEENEKTAAKASAGAARLATSSVGVGESNGHDSEGEGKVDKGEDMAALTPSHTPRKIAISECVPEKMIKRVNYDSAKAFFVPVDSVEESQSSENKA